MRCVQGMNVTTQDYEDLQLHAHSRVHQVCHVIVGFHVLCVDHGFHVVIGFGRLTVQQEGFIRQLHFTTHTQFQVQSSFLLDVVVPTLSCHRQLNLFPEFFHISHREPPVGYSRLPSAANDLAVTK